MKILHLPVNIASQIHVTVKALNAIGLEARGIILGTNPGHKQDGLKIVTPYGSRQRPIKYARSFLIRTKEVLEAIEWADVIHYHYATPALMYNMDLEWARLRNKPRLVEFWGADIYRPEVEAEDNPFFKIVSDSEYFRKISSANSLRSQKLFGRRGFSCVVSCPSLVPHVDRRYFRDIHLIRQRIDLEEFSPSFPNPDTKCPVIFHSPTAPIFKGTEHVRAALHALNREHRFEASIPSTRISRDENLRRMANCDIYLDQFIGGSYGLAAIEAMALGKPVLCYIKPKVLEQLPPDIPIVSANPDNLREKIEALLTDADLRNRLGIQSRAYVEKHHDSRKIAFGLRALYQKLVGNSHRGNN